MGRLRRGAASHRDVGQGVQPQHTQLHSRPRGSSACLGEPNHCCASQRAEFAPANGNDLGAKPRPTLRAGKVVRSSTEGHQPEPAERSAQTDEYLARAQRGALVLRTRRASSPTNPRATVQGA